MVGHDIHAETNNYEDIRGRGPGNSHCQTCPGMSRDDLITTNSKIMRSVASAIKDYAPNAFVIVISNPLDAMVTLCHKITGFPRNRVMGMAGVLDSARFAIFVALELGISVKMYTPWFLAGTETIWSRSPGSLM
jgi:malate dehydrogenase